MFENYDTFFKMGLGYTSRQNAEFVVLGRRGDPPRKSASVRQIMVEPAREHSRKPEKFYQNAETYAAGPRLELFGRQQRPGWTVRGNESDKFTGEAAQNAPEPRPDAEPLTRPEHARPKKPAPRPAPSPLAGLPDANKLLAKLRAGAGTMGPMPKLTAEVAGDD